MSSFSLCGEPWLIDCESSAEKEGSGICVGIAQRAAGGALEFEETKRRAGVAYPNTVKPKAVNDETMLGQYDPRTFLQSFFDIL